MYRGRAPARRGRDPRRRRARRSLDADSARTLGIETVHQNLSLVDTLDVAQNFFLNRELVYRNWAALSWMNRRGMYRQTREILSGFGLDVSPAGPSRRSPVGSGR